eukprot:Trichotokara_eunicae@DN6333_c0_g2_i7.p1
MNGSYSRAMDLALKSKTGLHFRGDDIMSKRVYDLLLTETVPILVTDNIKAKGLQTCFVPWDEMAIFVDETEFLLDPVGTIKEAIPSDEVLEQMQKAIRKYKSYVVWEHPEASDHLGSYILYEASRRCLVGLEKKDKEVFNRLNNKNFLSDKFEEVCPFGDFLIPWEEEEPQLSRKNWKTWRPTGTIKRKNDTESLKLWRLIRKGISSHALRMVKKKKKKKKKKKVLCVDT